MKIKKEVIAWAVVIVVVFVFGIGAVVYAKKTDDEYRHSKLVEKGMKDMGEWHVEQLSDDEKTCDRYLEMLYNDTEYEYYLPNPCYEADIVFEDGTRIEIKRALYEGKVTIEELISKGVSIRYSRKDSW